MTLMVARMIVRPTAPNVKDNRVAAPKTLGCGIRVPEGIFEAVGEGLHVRTYVVEEHLVGFTEVAETRLAFG